MRKYRSRENVVNAARERLASAAIVQVSGWRRPEG